MTAYQLPTGKTIFIDSNYLLNMTDNDIQDLIANDNGFIVNDPFYGSTIDIAEKDEVKDILLLEVPEIEDIEELNLSEDID